MFDAKRVEHRILSGLKNLSLPRETNCLGYVWWCLDWADPEQYISPDTAGQELFSFDSQPFHPNQKYSWEQGFLGLVVAKLPREKVVHAALLHPNKPNIFVERKGYNSRVREVAIAQIRNSYEKNREDVYSYLLLRQPRE